MKETVEPYVTLSRTRTYRADICFFGTAAALFLHIFCLWCYQVRGKTAAIRFIPRRADRNQIPSRAIRAEKYDRRIDTLFTTTALSSLLICYLFQISARVNDLS